MGNKLENFDVDVDIDKWGDYAIRFIAGLYENLAFFCKELDEPSIVELMRAIVSFIDGLDSDQRAFVQPSLGFVDNPADFEKRTLVLLPLFGTSAITEWVEGIVKALYKNPYFQGEHLAMMSDEKFVELQRLANIRQNHFPRK